MKKLLFLAAVAATVLASCAKTGDLHKNTGQGNAVGFGVYAGRTADTKATYGDITTANLAQSKDGFGVFAFYTEANDWADTYAPNFMYNQQVRNIASFAVEPAETNPSDYSAARFPSGWYYTPLKYWPNGQNSTEYAANTTSADRISFFAYAPHIATNNNGAVSSWVPATNQGITSITSNTQTGVPSVDFTVPSKVEEQIDLLWANPVLNATKQALSGRVAFTFRHALAKLNIQVRNVVDDLTGTTGNLANDNGNGDETLDDGETWVILKELVLTANGTKSGTLGLGSGNTEPNWSNLSGSTSVTYGTNKSFDAASYKENVASNDDIDGFKVTETATDLNSASSPMIIPREIAADGFVVKATYYVITRDSKLATGYSIVENVITKANADAITFAAGYKYNVVVNLGLNSIDFNVTEVTPWTAGASQEVHLPQNAS
jgi:hypothetical protein